MATVHDGRIARTQPRRVDLDAYVDARERQQNVEQLAHAVGAAAAHVVRPARRATLDERVIRADGVPDVRDVALRVEVADAQEGLPPSGFDLRDLLRERGRRVSR